MKRQFEIPTFIEQGIICWVTIMDDRESDVIEILKGTITSAPDKNKQCKVLYDGAKGPDMVDADRIYQRASDPIVCDDLCDVYPLNEPELVRNIRTKYMEKDIHIDCGPTLITVNPNIRGAALKEIPKTDDEFKNTCAKWAKLQIEEQPPPSKFVLGAKVYRSLFASRKDQAVCIAGESGAGKTYNTKAVMNFLSEICCNPDNAGDIPMGDKIDGCQPILESFGNATTIRNNDSSRFGK